jgi:DNA-binding transcriptional LysR family regulator
MITFEQLEALRAIVKAGTFSRAADKLYLTQPALSQRIRHLERALGAELFDHSHRGQSVQLTFAGQATLEFAEHVATEFERLQRQLRVLNDTAEREVLDIAVGPNAARHILPAILPRFQQQYPNIRMNVVESIAFGDMLPNLVRNGTCELAIGGTVNDDPKIRSIPLLTYHLVLIARKDHPVLSAGELQLAALFSHPFAVMPVQAGVRRDLERAALSVGTRLDVAIESFDFDVLKDAALRGLGLTVVPDLVLDDTICTSQLVTIEMLGFPRDVPIYLLHHAERELSPAARAFVAVAPQVMLQWGTPTLSAIGVGAGTDARGIAPL